MLYEKFSLMDEGKVRRNSRQEEVGKHHVSAVGKSELVVIQLKRNFSQWAPFQFLSQYHFQRKLHRTQVLHELEELKLACNHYIVPVLMMNPAMSTKGTKKTGITWMMVGTVLAKVPMRSPKEFPVIAFQRQKRKLLLAM